MGVIRAGARMEWRIQTRRVSAPRTLVTGHEPRASTASERPGRAGSSALDRSLTLEVPVPAMLCPLPSGLCPLGTCLNPNPHPGAGLSQVLSRPCPHRCRCGCLPQSTSNTHQPVFTNNRPFSIPSKHSQHSHPGTPPLLSSLHTASSAPAPTTNAPIGWRSSNSA